MSIVHGPNTVLSNLVLHLDAANVKSSKDGQSDWYDLSGYRNDGSLSGGAVYNSQYYGNIVFGGGNSVVIIPSGVTANLTNGYTLETWVSVGNIGDNLALIATNRDGNDDNSTFILSIDNRGDNTKPWSPNSEKMVLLAQYGYGSGYNYIGGYPYSGKTNGDNTYHQIVFVFKPERLILYFDGSIVAVSGFTSNPAYISDKTVRIGNQYDLGSSTFPLTGSISIVRLYDRALEPDEVYANFAGNFSRYSLSAVVPPNPSMTPTPSPTLTPFFTRTPTPTPTVTPTETPTNTPTPSITPTITLTPSITQTVTPTSSSLNLSPTPTSTNTPTPTPTVSSLNLYNLLTEDGDNLTTENGDFLEYEHN